MAAARRVAMATTFETVDDAQLRCVSGAGGNPKDLGGRVLGEDLSWRGFRDTMALHIGGATVAGTALGAGTGALFGGIGAGPGAVLGAAAGATAGTFTGLAMLGTTALARRVAR